MRTAAKINAEPGSGAKARTAAETKGVMKARTATDVMVVRTDAKPDEMERECGGRRAGVDDDPSGDEALPDEGADEHESCSKEGRSIRPLNLRIQSPQFGLEETKKPGTLFLGAGDP